MVSTDGQYSPPTEAHAESLDILSIPSVLKDLPHQLLVDKAACNFPLGSRQRDLIASAEYYKGKRGMLHWHFPYYITQITNIL